MEYTVEVVPGESEAPIKSVLYYDDSSWVCQVEIFHFVPNNRLQLSGHSYPVIQLYRVSHLVVDLVWLTWN